MQLKEELLTNDILIALSPNLHKLATICLTIPPASTTSAEQNFSDMKLIKNSLQLRRQFFINFIYEKFDASLISVTDPGSLTKVLLFVPEA